MKGVSVDVFRCDGTDSTSGGESSPERAKNKTFVVFDPEIQSGNYTLAECMANPLFVCLKIVRRDIGGEIYKHVEPIVEDAPRGRRMFGGNFVFTSDSRLRRIASYPMPVHDRVEVA